MHIPSFGRRLAYLLGGVLLAALPRLLPAQQTKANAALLHCLKTIGASVKWDPNDTVAMAAEQRRTQAFNALDSAGKTAYRRKVQDSEDSVKAAGRACLSRVAAAEVADTLLDSLSAGQLRFDDLPGAFVTSQRILHSRLPLVDRYNAVKQIYWRLPADSVKIAALRALMPVVDSLHNLQLSAEDRFAFVVNARGADSMSVYRAIDDMVQYVTALNPAERDTVLPQVLYVLGWLGLCAETDYTGTASVALAAKFGALYPGNAQLLQSLDRKARNVTMLRAKAPPLESASWLRNPSRTAMPVAGRVTVVEFTTVWCSACKFTYEPLEKLYKELKGDGLDVVMVVPPNGETEAGLEGYRRMFEHYGATYPVMMMGPAPAADDWYGVIEYPHIALVDRHGVIREVVKMAWTESSGPIIEKKIRDLLAER